MTDLKRLGDLSDADLWDKLGTNEVPWFNGATELYERLVARTDHLAEALQERNEATRDAADRAAEMSAQYQGLQRGYDEANRERVEALRASEAWRSDCEKAERALVQARVETDQVIAQRDALQALLARTQDDLSRIWSTLRAARA